MKKMSNRERFYPLKKLAQMWLNDFVQNKKTYFETLIPMIVSKDFSKFTEEENKILLEIDKNFSRREWKNFKALFSGTTNRLIRENHNHKILELGRRYIKEDNFVHFEKLRCESISNKNILKNLDEAYKLALESYINNLKKTLIQISVKDVKSATSYFYKAAKKLPDGEKENIGLFLEDIEDLSDILEQYNFREADKLFQIKRVISKNEYENLKKEYILKYFSGRNIDNQKALAISSVHTNVLLKARAGSGKTSTLCLKTILLAEKYNINLDEILILAFNKEARLKIKKDLCEKYGLNNCNGGRKEGFDGAKTFHSFAKSICGNIKLVDDKKRFLYIHEAITRVLESAEYKEIFYNFYKTSLNVPTKHDCKISNDSDVTFIKSLSQMTLRGELVKSSGEKYIADFLFENGIEYEYEKTIIFTKEEKEALNIDDDWNIYRPDFYIKYHDKEFYLEHWGVDEKALDSDYFGRKNVINDVSKYVRNIHTKRKYFKKKNIPLIETWAKHSQIRENFEITLYDTLKKFGITAEKQPYDILFEKVKDLNIKSFYKTIDGFISTIKKSKLDNFFIERKCNDKSLSKRTRIFLELGYEIYLEYQKLLQRENLYDFDDLIANAVQKIMETKGECGFKVSNGKTIKVKDIKYLLIDEYQDFSKLFFDLVSAIKCFNPKLKIFATGDDWQAINGFAGSDLYYFKNFKNLFMNSEIYTLTNNYRSNTKIINVSNTLMGPNDALSCPVKNEAGEVCKMRVDKTYIKKDNSADYIYAFKNDPGRIKAKYLKTVHRLIRLHPDKNILILSRLNKIAGSNLEFDFAYKLLKMKTVNKNKVKVMTIHKSKGLEADIVIILRAINGVIPFIHPDYEIMAALNKTFDEILDEEKRLFYVAMTRAKEKVYVLSETHMESVYLKDLILKEINFKSLNFTEINLKQANK